VVISDSKVSWKILYKNQKRPEVLKSRTSNPVSPEQFPRASWSSYSALQDENEEKEDGRRKGGRKGALPGSSQSSAFLSRAPFFYEGLDWAKKYAN